MPSGKLAEQFSRAVEIMDISEHLRVVVDVGLLVVLNLPPEMRVFEKAGGGATGGAVLHTLKCGRRRSHGGQGMGHHQLVEHRLVRIWLAVMLHRAQDEVSQPGFPEVLSQLLGKDQRSR